MPNPHYSFENTLSSQNTIEINALRNLRIERRLAVTEQLREQWKLYKSERRLESAKQRASALIAEQNFEIICYVENERFTSSLKSCDNAYLECEQRIAIFKAVKEPQNRENVAKIWQEYRAEEERYQRQELTECRFWTGNRRREAFKILYPKDSHFEVIAWEPNKPNCVCEKHTLFSLFTRRHHCRRCGALGCLDCNDFVRIHERFFMHLGCYELIPERSERIRNSATIDHALVKQQNSIGVRFCKKCVIEMQMARDVHRHPFFNFIQNHKNRSMSTNYILDIYF